MKDRRRAVSLLLFCSTILLLCGGCGSGGQGDAMQPIDGVQEQTWEELGMRKIYFGHQSVGQNILDGVAEILTAHPEIDLEIVETDDPGRFGKPLLAHGRVGENRNPSSKIEAFKERMDRGLGDLADIAFFKFCYVDFSANTDPEKVFLEYNSVMDDLARRYPDTKFLHVTAPLVSKESKLRTIAKKILGKQLRPYRENAVRTRFNEMMRAEYGESGLLFDLAMIESTREDGTRLTYGSGSDFMYALVPRYTDDGGHLNEVGRRLVAEQFLLFLAKAAGA
jgi:hypothetical protein